MGPRTLRHGIDLGPRQRSEGTSASLSREGRTRDDDGRYGWGGHRTRVARGAVRRLRPRRHPPRLPADGRPSLGRGSRPGRVRTPRRSAAAPARSERLRGVPAPDDREPRHQSLPSSTRRARLSRARRHRSCGRGERRTTTSTRRCTRCFCDSPSDSARRSCCGSTRTCPTSRRQRSSGARRERSDRSSPAG